MSQATFTSMYDLCLNLFNLKKTLKKQQQQQNTEKEFDQSHNYENHPAFLFDPPLCS